MSHHAEPRDDPTAAPVTNSEGSITYKGYSVPKGSAQHDDVARL
jgi:hypothetical protein